MNEYQNTIEYSVECSGVGVHTGSQISLSFHPAPPDTGVIFIRSDVTNRNESIIPASFRNVSSTRLCTTISNQYGFQINTVEHLMSARWGSGIDNLIIRINGDELPIMDGSSDSFLMLFDIAGITRQNVKRKYIQLIREVTLEEDDKYISVKPSNSFIANVKIEFDNAVIQSQEFNFGQSNMAFKHLVSRARTFCLERDIQRLQSVGLIRGGSIDSAILVNDEKVLNNEGLRFNDEFVRHKLLDLIGDFSLLDYPILCNVNSIKSGHEMNNRMLRKIFSDPKNYKIYEA